MNLRVGLRMTVATGAVTAGVATVGVVLAVASFRASAPTGSVSSEKQQFLAHQDQQLASAQAAPRAAKVPLARPAPVAATPCNPAVGLPFPDGGIHNGGQGGPFGSSANFYAVSSWAGTFSPGGQTFAVWAGTTGEASSTPGLPAVDVYAEKVLPNGCGVDFTPVGIFVDSRAGGALTIARVAGNVITLTSPGSSRVYFSWITHAFSSNPSA